MGKWGTCAKDYTNFPSTWNIDPYSFGFPSPHHTCPVLCQVILSANQALRKRSFTQPPLVAYLSSAFCPSSKLGLRQLAILYDCSKESNSKAISVVLRPGQKARADSAIRPFSHSAIQSFSHSNQTSITKCPSEKNIDPLRN